MDIHQACLKMSIEVGMACQQSMQTSLDDVKVKVNTLRCMQYNFKD